MTNEEFNQLKENLNDLYILYTSNTKTCNLDQINEYLDKYNSNYLKMLSWFIGENIYELWDDFTNNIINEERYISYDIIYHNIQNIIDNKLSLNSNKRIKIN